MTSKAADTMAFTDSAGSAETTTARTVPTRTLAVVLVAVGVALRAVAILLGWPPLNSDEATVGLMARHIAHGGHIPVFFYGQDYMGAIEAYAAAPLFALFDSATPLLRLQALAWFTLLAWSVYRLTTIVYSPRIALLAVALLVPFSDRILFVQVRMAGGYPEIVPLAAVLILGAVLLARGRATAGGVSGSGSGRVRAASPSRRARWFAWRRTAGFAAWGLVAGIAVWDDWLVLPYLAAAAVLLVAFCWREVPGRAGVAAVVGGVTGAAPLWLANLVGHAHSINTFLVLNGMRGPTTANASWLQHLRGGVVVATPLAAGVCPGWTQCTSISTWWGPLYVALLTAAGILAAVGLRRALAGRAEEGSDPDPGMGSRDTWLTHGTRLALVGAAAATLWSFSKSPAAVLTPINSSRYLSIMVVSSPAALWPLVAAPALVRRWSRWASATARVLRTAVVAAVVALMLMATVRVFQEARSVPEGRRNEKALVSTLDHLSISNIYSDYWTCDSLVFTTRERISCAVIEDDLSRGQNRYPQYWTRVRKASRKAYVVRPTSAARAVLAARYPDVRPIQAASLIIFPVP